MGWVKRIVLGPDGEKISETPFVDTGSWDRDSVVEITNADGTVSSKRFNTGDTQAEAGAYIADTVGKAAVARAKETKDTEAQGILSTLNAAMGGLKGAEAAAAGEGSLLRAQLLGGKAGEGATAVNIDPRLSQTGQATAELNQRLRERGVSHGTVGAAQGQNIYNTAQNTLNQATMKSQGDLAAKRAELDAQKAMAEAKLKRKLTADASGAYV